jgi:hypothetical protein
MVWRVGVSESVLLPSMLVLGGRLGRVWWCLRSGLVWAGALELQGCPSWSCGNLGPRTEATTLAQATSTDARQDTAPANTDIPLLK